MTKKKINLLSPNTRSFQMDHIYNQTYKNEFGGIGIEQTPIVFCINNMKKVSLIGLSLTWVVSQWD